MKTFQKSAALFLASFLAVSGCGNSTPTTAREDDAPAKAAPVAPAQSVNYGEEVSRNVYEKDEIVSILKNGMTVIVKRVPSPVVTVRAYIKTGGVYEGKWLGGGLSHLLEHLVAGGSNQRRTEEQNRNLLQEIGNNSNAYTYPDHTAFFVNTTADHLDQAVDLVAGWVLGAKITPAEYAREYEVVQRELEKDNGEPDWVFYYNTQRNRYLVSPSKVPVIGYQEVIQGLSRDDVYNYYKLAYHPNNMVFVVAGSVNPETMLEAVKKNVAAAPPGRAFSHDIQEEPPVVAPRVLVSTFPKLGEAKLELAFPSIKLTNPDLYALDLLATALAHGESSVMIEEVRDKGLVSEIAAGDDTPFYNNGTFSVDMQLEMAKVPEASKAVLAILERVKKEGLSEDRIKAAKTQMKTARAFSLQTAEDIGESMATDYIGTGDPHFSDHYVERIQKVTNEDLKRVAAKYLDTARLLTTAMLPEEAVGGKEGLAKAEAMLRGLTPQAEHKTEKASAIVKVKMKDGTTVLLKRVATSPMVVINLYSLGGLTAEDEKTNGLGNLTMLTLPRGTKTRSAQQIAEFFDSIGGALNTTCGNNSWNWQSICLKEDFGKTIEVFADVVKNASFPEAEVDPMRKRTLAAIESQDADWFAQSMRFFRKTYFGPKDEPYQFVALGTKETVSKFTAEQMRKWYADKILGGNRVLAVFGDIDVDKAKEAIAGQFGGVAEPEAPVNVHWFTPESATQPPAKPSITIREVAINKSTNPQAGVIMGFDANPVIGNPANFPLTVADTLCSGYGYPTGYIFETLRGKGLVYDANAMSFPGQSAKLPGTFIVYAGCDPKNVDACIDDILLNIARMQGSPQDIVPAWFDRAKKLITTEDAMDNETAQQQAQTAALDELFGLGYNYHDQFADKINKVRMDEVQEIARRLLRSCVITVTTSSPESVKAVKGVRTYDQFPPVDLTPKGVTHDSGAASH
jgi:zinc protease